MNIQKRLVKLVLEGVDSDHPYWFDDMMTESDVKDMIDEYTNKRVIQELEELSDWEDEMPAGLKVWINNRIKELKQ